MRHEFIRLTVKNRNTRILATGVFIAVLAIAVYATLQLNPNLEFEWKIPETVTLTWLFFLSATGGLFFLPIPMEAVFTRAIATGSSELWSVVAVILGFTLGNIVSYLIGWRLNRFIRLFVSPKKLFGIKRKVNKYGVYAVLGMNALPFMPSPLLSFGLGITRYNFARLFTVFIIGNLLKYGGILAIARFI
ncbi:MAG: VTT domain-containing protein [Candidatus Woesearchaeota archaeon]|nr:VTT domain-containing protein [Candidatus Woesearchaeota archaeon]